MGDLIFNLLGQAPDAGGLDGVTHSINVWIRTISTIFLSFCGLLITVYAVWMGWKFAKASDDAARKNAKSQVIYAIIGVVGIVAVIMVTQLIVPVLRASRPDMTGHGHYNRLHGLTEAWEAASNIVTALLNAVATAAVIYGVYVGWQFMKADDDSKRKAAKTQLLYVVIGVVAVVLVQVVATAVFSQLATGGMLTRDPA